MTEELKSALSAEEWAIVARGNGEVRDITRYWIEYSGLAEDTWRIYTDPDTGTRELAALVAIANHSLPDSDPRKINRADVEAIREAAEFRRVQLKWGGYEDDPQFAYPIEQNAVLAALAAKLSSLLPPETP